MSENYIDQEFKELEPEDLISLEFSPTSPMSRGTVSFQVTLDGEKIVDLEPEIGFHHRGFEKQAESSSYLQIIPLAARLNFNSSILNTIAYSMAVEKLFQKNVPKRAEFARVILGELARVTDHMNSMGNIAFELGVRSFYQWMIKAKEYTFELFEEVTGARINSNWTRFGGNASDFPPGFLKKLKVNLSRITRLVKEAEKMLKKNYIFLSRLQGIGVINQEKALSYGFSGPALRATGIAHDLRFFDNGYSVYDQFEFTVPVGTVGDSYDRFLIRLEEVKQSISIIRQAMGKIPLGGILNHDLSCSIPGKKLLLKSQYIAQMHADAINKGYQPPAGEIYSAIEGTNGEIGFYLVADGSAKPVRCRFRPACLNYVPAIKEMAIGHTISDLNIIFSSLNIVSGELDR